MNTTMTNRLKNLVLSRVLDDDYLSGNYEYHLNWLEQQFYKFKLIVCILLGLYVPNPKEDGLTVMLVEYKPWYYGWDAKFVSVGLGIFRKWQYTFYSDGDSCI